MKTSICNLFCLLLAMILIGSMISCEKQEQPPVETSLQVTETPTAPVVTCAHEYGDSITTPAMPLRDGSRTSACTLCGYVNNEVIPATKTLKILAVGNSFSVDAMEYLWSICRYAGVKNIILGNLYIGGCTLDMHHDAINNKKASYTYYKNTAGEWKTTSNVTAQKALQDEEWDIITLQQSSKTCGVQTSYARLSSILSLLREQAPNAKFYFHMTWAYQQDSTHSSFPTYNNDQMTMFNKTVEAVQRRVTVLPEIVGVIPAGTAIQNLRTSYIGDTLTRDGYHLSYDYGRYTAALTWFLYFTGGDLSNVTWVPSKYASIKEDFPAIHEAVTAAISNPFAVTQATQTQK
ncbi:MAG: DUF4886 domain-containing protein [Ruminococcaceae bacterium]|nr:DUF4886 domain-containing protein [Oscillospiraceae bacterium]